MIVILVLRSASSDSNSSVAVLASPLVVGYLPPVESCSESTLFFSSKSDTLAFNTSNSFEEVVLDALRVPLGPVALKLKVGVLGREERWEIPVVPLAAQEIGRQAADGSLGEIAFSRSVEEAEAGPAVAVLDSADIEGRGRCEGAVGVVVEVAALLTLLAVHAVLPAEDRRSAVELVELLELDAVPFFSAERVAFAAGEAIAGSRS